MPTDTVQLSTAEAESLEALLELRKTLEAVDLASPAQLPNKLDEAVRAAWAFAAPRTRISLRHYGQSPPAGTPFVWNKVVEGLQRRIEHGQLRGLRAHTFWEAVTTADNLRGLATTEQA